MSISVPPPLRLENFFYGSVGSVTNGKMQNPPTLYIMLTDPISITMEYMVGHTGHTVKKHVQMQNSDCTSSDGNITIGTEGDNGSRYVIDIVKEHHIHIPVGSGGCGG